MSKTLDSPQINVLDICPEGAQSVSLRGTNQMKFKLALLALLLPVTAHSADYAAQTRARYAAVDRAVPKLKPITRHLKGYSPEGGELTAYFQKGVPLKMIVKHHSKTMRVIDEFYFWKGRLFFVLNTREFYEKPRGVPGSPGKITGDQNRYYFTKGKLTHLVDFENQTLVKSLELQQREQLRYARRMLAGARGKAKVIIAP